MLNNKPEDTRLYQICIAERLDCDWADWFDGLAITPMPEGGTALQGPLIDQAALIGLLNKLYYLNLTLVSVQRLSG